MVNQTPDYSTALKALVRSLDSRSSRDQGAISEQEGNYYRNFAQRLTSAATLEATLQCVLDEMGEAAQADRGFIMLMEEDNRPVYSVVWKQEGEANIHDVFPHSRTLVERAVAGASPILVPDAQSDPAFAGSISVTELDLRLVVVIPLIIGGKAIGIVYFDSRSIHPQLSAQDMTLLESLAACATLAIRNSRLNSEISKRLQKLQLLNEVSLAINATRELEQLLHLILQQSLSLCGGDHGYILLGEGEDVDCLASLDKHGRKILDIEVSWSIVKSCLRENKSICIVDTHADSSFQTKSVMALDLRSIMCVPLEANQQLIGVLYISSQAITKTFTPQDQSLLESIANQAALTIRNAQLLKEQETQIVELERALQMVREAQQRAVTDGLTGLYNHVYFKEQLLSAVKEAGRYSKPLSIVLVDLDHFKKINDTHGHQTGDEVLRQVSDVIRRLARDCDLVARYGGEELALILPQTDVDGAAILAHRLCEAISEIEIRSISSGELLRPTASLGVASYRTGLTMTELIERADRALYSAKHLGRNRVCLDGETRDLPVEELRERWELPHNLMVNAVAGLAEAINAKDSYTGGHSAHVERLAIDLGVAIGLSGHQLDEVEMAARLHDVGKIGIPDAILRKPGPLDEEEWRVMKTHAVLGARILAAANLPSLAKAVRHHHERWDGKGYPDGLMGEEIPLTARIVTIIDAWGAMVTDRVYRKSIGRERAIEELRRCAGTQFDPRLVEAFVALVSRKPGSDAKA